MTTTLAKSHRSKYRNRAGEEEGSLETTATAAAAHAYVRKSAHDEAHEAVRLTKPNGAPRPHSLRSESKDGEQRFCSGRATATAQRLVCWPERALSESRPSGVQSAAWFTIADAGSLVCSAALSLGVGGVRNRDWKLAAVPLVPSQGSLFATPM